MAAFIHTGEGWVVESSTKSAIFSGQWGHPPDAHIVPISSDHVGVRLDGPGAFATYVSILVPWNGEIREAFGTIIAEGNGAVCGDEEGMQPCVGTQRKITFVKGANPSYDDIVLTLSGAAVSEKPPFKVVEVNGTERSTFSGRQVRPCSPLVLHALVLRPKPWFPRPDSAATLRSLPLLSAAFSGTVRNRRSGELTHSEWHEKGGLSRIMPT